MRREIANEYKRSIEQANAAEQRSDLDSAFAALERAHILAQRYLFAHIYTHWRMLKVGIKRQDVREMFGQVVRMLAIVPAYLVGWVPMGNTGGSNVSALRPMSLPADIAPLLEDFSVWRDVLKRVVLLLLLLLSGLAAL